MGKLLFLETPVNCPELRNLTIVNKAAARPLDFFTSKRWLEFAGLRQSWLVDSRRNLPRGIFGYSMNPAFGYGHVDLLNTEATRPQPARSC